MPRTLSLLFTAILYFIQMEIENHKEDIICSKSHVYYRELNQGFSDSSGYTTLKLQEKNNYCTF